MLKVYVAHAMTGRTGEAMIAESERAATAARMVGIWYGTEIELLDPVITEGVRREETALLNPSDKLAEFWKRDKAMIREAHVLIDLTGSAKSEGVAHEIGYARFGLWKPVVRVYPELGPSIARFEDDVIAKTFETAFYEAAFRWGTFYKRLKWRLGMLNRSLPKWIIHQIGEFK